MLLPALEAILGVIDRLARWGAGVALLVMTFVLFGNSLARYLFGESFVGGEELARVLVIWLTFLAAYLVVRANAHVTIDILLRLVSERGYRIVTAITSTVGAATTGYITWYGVILCDRIWSGGQMSSVLPMLKVVFYLPIPIGCGLMCIGFVVNAVSALNGTLKRPAEMTVAIKPAGE